MPDEHLIRLRGAWDRPAAAGPGPAPGEARTTRVDLPTDWPPGLRAPFRLVRRFHRPAIDPRRERLSLRLRAIAGVREVRLNDVPVARPAPDAEALEIPLAEPLPPRNVLVLEIDPARWPDPAAPPAGWGAIALVIRPLAE